MPDMQSPLSSEASTHQIQTLSESDYARLRQDLAQDLKQEIRRAGHQHLFAMGLQALVLVFMAVVLFLSSDRHHDFMLWAVGICLLLFGMLEFLDLDYVQTGHHWLGAMQRRVEPENKPPADEAH